MHSVGTQHIGIGQGSVDGHHVDAYSQGQVNMPVVLGHTGDDVASMQLPVLSHAGVLYPGVAVLLGQSRLAQRVLYEDRWMRLHSQVHDTPLVVHQILYAQGAAYHFAACAIVVELPVLQWQDGCGEAFQQAVGPGWTFAQSASEVAVQVVVGH